MWRLGTLAMALASCALAPMGWVEEAAESADSVTWIHATEALDELRGAHPSQSMATVPVSVQGNQQFPWGIVRSVSL